MITIPGKIPIRIYPLFWFLITVIGWINSFSFIGTAIWAVIIFFSVLIHEYGHALTAIAFGQRAHIELVGLGGVTHRDGTRLSLWKEFIIVLNGPIAGLALSCLAYAVQKMMGFEKPTNYLQYAIEITLVANIFWTIVNLLPINPLDGGRLLSIILESIFGIRGIKISLFISSVLAVAISILFFISQAFLAGALFLMLAFESYKAWKSSLLMTADDQDTDLQGLLKKAEEDLHAGRVEDAKQALEHVRESTGQGVLYVAATEDLAKALHLQGNFKDAYNLLAPIAKKLSPNALRLLHEAAFKVGALKEATIIGDRVYQVSPSYDTALTNALCYALLGDARPSVGWLQRAISDGLPNLSAILRKDEFDKIKSDTLFMELKKRYL